MSPKLTQHQKEYMYDDTSLSLKEVILMLFIIAGLLSIPYIVVNHL